MTRREQRRRRRLEQLAERLRADGRERHLARACIAPFITGPVRVYALDEILERDGSPRDGWVELT